MPEFSAEAVRRIAAVVRHVERDRINSSAQRPVYNSGGWDFVWVELREHLQASGMGAGSGGDDEATGRILSWSKSGSAYTAGATDVTVTDTTGQHWGLAYERLWCRIIGAGSSYLYEPITSGAAGHKGILNEALAYGDSAVVTVTIAGESVNVLAYDNFLCSGDDDLAASSKVWISYDVGDHKWYVTAADCGC